MKNFMRLLISCIFFWRFAWVEAETLAFPDCRSSVSFLRNFCKNLYTRIIIYKHMRTLSLYNRTNNWPNEKICNRPENSIPGELFGAFASWCTIKFFNSVWWTDEAPETIHLFLRKKNKCMKLLITYNIKNASNLNAITFFTENIELIFPFVIW